MTFDKNLDAYILGDNDPNNPANQHDEPDQIQSIEEALEDGNEERAFEIISEVRTDIDHLRQVAKASDNKYFFNRLNLIYQKL